VSLENQSLLVRSITYLLRTNALAPFVALSALSCSTDCIARTLTDQAQCACAIDLTLLRSIAPATDYHIFTFTLDRIVLALECISTISTRRPEVAKF
jgi:hypothetical protein